MFHLINEDLLVKTSYEMQAREVNLGPFPEHLSRLITRKQSA